MLEFKAFVVFSHKCQLLITDMKVKAEESFKRCLGVQRFIKPN